jgi:folate-dependent phosphoribosylglycinamide formyltransferase PurN
MLNIAVLCSKRAPGLDGLLRHPERGVLFDVDCIVTSEPWTAPPVQGIPVISHPIRPFYRAYGKKLSDMSVRRRYDAATAQLLFPLTLDAVVLLGYLYVITEPLLLRFPYRILNVHDSDLPRYPGLHATRDAIAAGEKETRSTVHIVTPALDAGPVVARSEPFPVEPFAPETVRAHAYRHRERMMRGWGDLVVNGLKTLVTADQVVA